MKQSWSTVAVKKQVTTSVFFICLKSFIFRSPSLHSPFHFICLHTSINNFKKNFINDYHLTSANAFCVWWWWCSHQVMSDSCDPMDYSLSGSSVCDSPSKNTGLDCHFLLQRIFLIQELNPDVLHCRQILYQLS